ncbi:phage baseplate assembly protein [Providencia hangzhouensis]|uniref:Mu-like prophage tail protein gpP n=1 Tax=Providencia rettgeri TaxID=587 RepID=A0A9N8H2V7_PRORE|nr:phage tail protein [Providencia rettgeri]CAB5645843.1 Mu-like prophage tail protein gpP [Providencia rettgeri]CAB5713068.1 Mu-like prophage tail protein gpP [Providencia rettgeri]CAC9220628.1 Mu-like prophage tail protein gpP [Providencia rettgeri]CAC9268987.1 Mu-like prophage tail protein gpP [Providencia rettgeri]
MANTIELKLGNTIYSGWKKLDVTRSLEDMSGQFSLGITVKSDDSPLVLKPGQACQLAMNGQPVVTGYVDSVDVSISSDERTITLAGRDKTGDLVDCAAVHGKGQWRNVPLETIAKDLCKPFGVTVRWQVTDAAAASAFRQWQIEPGETVFDNLSRAARHRGVLMTSNAAGELVFASAGTQSVATLILGQSERQGVKVLSLDSTLSWQERFSVYRVKGASAAGGRWGETQTATQSTAVYMDTKDPDITRYRPTIIIADDNMTNAKGTARAQWEQKRAMAHATKANVTVQGWFKSSGQLWQTNEIAQLQAVAAGFVDESLLIVSVNFLLDNDGGTTTRLELMPRDGFTEPAEPEVKGKHSDIRWKP